MPPVLSLFVCRRVQWRLLGGLLAIVLVFAAGATAHAQVTPPRYEAEEVQAAFLFNFLAFTDWPEDALPANAPYVIGVVGNRRLEDELLSLADRQKVRERRVRVTRVKNQSDLGGCHLVYIAADSRATDGNGPEAEELLPFLREKPVLTVSGASDFLREGGIVRLYPSRGRLRFEISQDAARRAGLVLSSQLLALAHPET